MNSCRVSRRLTNCYNYSFEKKFRYTTAPLNQIPTQPTHNVIDADVHAARAYCSNLIQKFDSPSYTLQTFIPVTARDAYLSIRALNVELSRIPDLVSNPTVGALRMQFWRDVIGKTFENNPPREPIALLLGHALSFLRSRHANINTSVMKGWFLKIINAREQYMNNRPYTSLSALETYAENTYSTLMYLTLAALPINSMAADHIASHIGKATGIAAVLRGIPLIAFPPPPNNHSNNAAFSATLGGNSKGRQGAVVLPLDVMAETGVSEEEVFRKGANAPGLNDAVFTVATRANDHLLTAREMLKNLKQGRDVGHEFEYAGEVGHQYPKSASRTASPINEIERSFGVYMPAVVTSLWLRKLEKYNFDIFRPEMRAREWRLPWKSFWAYRRKSF